MKNQSSLALLSSVALTLILCGSLSMFVDSKILNNFILGVCIFTLMFSISDFINKGFFSFAIKVFSIPIAFIVTTMLLFLDVDAAFLNRINNFSTLVTLGITIFLIAEQQSISDRETLQKIIDLYDEKNEAKSDDPKK